MLSDVSGPFFPSLSSALLLVFCLVLACVGNAREYIRSHPSLPSSYHHDRVQYLCSLLCLISKLIAGSEAVPQRANITQQGLVKHQTWTWTCNVLHHNKNTNTESSGNRTKRTDPCTVRDAVYITYHVRSILDSFIPMYMCVCPMCACSVLLSLRDLVCTILLDDTSRVAYNYIQSVITTYYAQAMERQAFQIRQQEEEKRRKEMGAMYPPQPLLQPTTGPGKRGQEKTSSRNGLTLIEK